MYGAYHAASLTCLPAVQTWAGYLEGILSPQSASRARPRIDPSLERIH